MSGAFLVAIAAVLLASGVAHLVHFTSSRATVADQHVVPVHLAGPLVAVVVVLELVLGGGTLGAVLTGSSGQRVFGLLCAALFVAFAGYTHLAWLRRTDRDVLCACGVGEAPLGFWVTLRSGLLAGLAICAAVFASASTAWFERPAFEQIVMACAALSLSIAVTLLPTARAPLTTVRAEALR